MLSENTIAIYLRWEDVPANLKTKSSLKQMGLKPKRGQQPAGIKTHWDYKIPDYNLYDVAEAVPNTVSDKQRAAIAKAQEESLKKRTCIECGWVEELGRNYRNKPHVSGGLCPNCREQAKHLEDHNSAIEWAKTILLMPNVLILDTETSDLDGEIIELAVINLQGETVFNSRFNPVLPISEGARAVHGISAEMVADSPRFAVCVGDVLNLLAKAELVLIYNAAFDVARIRQTCQLHGIDMPKIKTNCLMEWYAQYCGQWSNYHQSYKWQPLNGGHDALGDCLAALACLKEMAGQDVASL